MHAQLRHRDAAQGKGRCVVTGTDMPEGIDGIAQVQRTGRGGDQ
jgi:hypothetical protein